MGEGTEERGNGNWIGVRERKRETESDRKGEEKGR